ncbi:ROK family transcriptional regulator [Bacillus sp. Marseille-P3661]|uniref:ROK family transcriptional regulator n=1 Tax=Bacillus sp. Marseille-P3661 TaxID=1936234 RepID=UPI000C86617B|nr:ROK family transcriptional regulator [Bacillus sp. Marseille-P3661]
MIKNFFLDNSKKNQIQKEVFQYVRNFGPISKSQLLEKLKIKQTPLARIIIELQKRGFIKESGLGESEGGRRPVLYSIVPDAGYIFAVHIIRAQTKVVLYDLLLNKVEDESFNMTPNHTPEIVISLVIQIIKRFIEKYRIHFDQLLGIGISTIGPLNKDQGIILNPDAFFSSGWVNVEIVRMLEEAFPVRIILENAANTALVGEFKHVSLTDKNLLYIINSWGLGCGVITNGEVNSKIGETGGFGHMVIDKEGRPCSCGKRGCLNTYTSIFSVIHSLKENTDLFNDINWKELSTQEVIKLLTNHFVITSKIILESAEDLGIGIANMVNLLGSEVVFISGPLVYNYPNYYETVKNAINANLNQERSVSFSQGTLKEEAPDLGAGSIVYDSYF